jgi:hypothetical protein
LTLSLAEFPAQAEPRTFFFVRLMSFLYSLTQGDYWIMSIYMSVFSAFATWVFVYELVKITREHKFVVYIALLFIPSITFWSSGLLKESLMTIAMYSLGFTVIRWLKEPKKLWFIVPTLLSVYVLWKVKYYVPITLIPILILTLIFYRDGFLKRFGFSNKLLLYFALIVVGGLAIAFMHPVFSSGRFFELVRISHDVVAQNSNDAIIHFQDAGSDQWFFIINLGLSWFTGIFRPLIWESFDTLSLLWAIQKSFFVLLGILAIIVSRKITFTKSEIWWGIAILIYASVLASVITLASPNFGTLVRYEVAYMPLLWLLVLLIFNKYRKDKFG